MNFCYHSKKDECKPYKALFSLITLLCLLYLSNIFINIIWSKFAYINVLTVLKYSVLRSNLAINTSKIHKKTIIKIVALISRL